MVWVFLILCFVCPILCPLWIFLAIVMMVAGKDDKK